MMRYGLRAWGIASVAVMALMAWQATAWGVPLDKDGDIKLGVRTYVNARIQSEHTDRNVVYEPTNNTPNAPLNNTSNAPVKVQESQTFPYSPPGHLRQNRFYIEAELDHDLDRLAKSFGPLPFDLELPAGRSLHILTFDLPDPHLASLHPLHRRH